ncbi:retrotransposon protein [Tanacetum coccineum]|uniref:Retrotransposon protein n=1 Tax=Tanacetum coccineum TaxID=301880 RepID=A0ABQ5FB70_9ASTR
MEQYMSKTRGDYGSGFTRHTINQDTHFKLKGKFPKELRDNNFNGSEHDDANKHIEKVLEIVDLFHIPKITQDQIMLRAFPLSLTGAASRWLRNQPSGSITTWEVLKTKFLNKYCPPARIVKKMEEINNFQLDANYARDHTIQRIIHKRKKEKLYKKLTIHSSLHPINLEDNIEQQGQDSTNETIETLLIRNQGASIKTLEIQIVQMSKVLQEGGFRSLPSSTETNPRDQLKLISTAKADFSKIRRIGYGSYVVSGTQHRTVPFPRRLQNFSCDDWREAQDVKILDAYDHTLPQKEKDLGSFTLSCFIHNIYFDKAVIDPGASVSVMPFSTYTNLGLGILSHTRYGYIENHKKTIKNGQARTRERKSAQKPETKPK